MYNAVKQDFACFQQDPLLKGFISSNNFKYQIKIKYLTLLLNSICNKQYNIIKIQHLRADLGYCWRQAWVLLVFKLMLLWHKPSTYTVLQTKHSSP